MVKTFENIIGRIYRLKVPFEDLYTSVFLIRTEQGNALVDCATYDCDIDEYILPALKEIGLSLTDINFLILTHSHGDHAGGKTRILELSQNIEIVQKASSIFSNTLTMCEMKGHTLDCIGVFDEDTGTLISGDCLQGAGVGKYRCSLANKDEYLKTIDKIEQNEKVRNILFSHAYEPWYKDGAFGREEIEKCLQDCKKYAIEGEIKK